MVILVFMHCRAPTPTQTGIDLFILDFVMNSQLYIFRRSPLPNHGINALKTSDFGGEIGNGLFGQLINKVYII